MICYLKWFQLCYIGVKCNKKIRISTNYDGDVTYEENINAYYWRNDCFRKG
jgi:hypothetical protein